MKFIKQVFDFYISASIHVALAVYALLRVTEFYLNLPYNETLSYFVFYATIFGYNFIKYGEIIIKNTNDYSQKLKLIIAISTVSGLATTYYGYQLNTAILLLFIPFGLLSLFYCYPFSKKNLRHIPTLKIIIISLVWAGITTIIPIFDKGIELKTLFILWLQRFLFVIALTLPFDIRDFKTDIRNLNTLPQLIGIERTKKTGFIILSTCIFLEFFITPNQVFKGIFTFIFFTLIVFLQRASEHQSKYYSSFWVEAIPIFWFLLLLTSKIINL